MSTKLREFRQQHGWSRTRLCYLLARQAYEEDTALPHVDSLRRMLSRWENGYVVPSELYRPLLAKVYNVSEDDLGLDDALPTALVLNQSDRAGRIPTSEVDEALSIAGGTRLSTVTIDALESSITDIWKRDDQYGGEALRPAVAAQLRHVLSLLSQCRDDSQRGRLQSIAAELARLTGWMLFDARQFSAGRTYFEEALQLAREIDDQPFVANVLASMSLQATYLDRPKDALTLARSAQDVCRPTATPRVRSMLAMREAFAHATLGDRGNCHACINGAQKDLEKGDGSNRDPEWVTYFGETKLVTDTGIALSQLGEPQAAEPLIKRGLSWQDSTNTRTRAFHSYWLARTQLHSGNLEEACTTGDTVKLATAVDSARVFGHLDELQQQLRSYEHTSVARDARELVTERMPG